MLTKHKPIRDRKHLAWIRALPCLVCGRTPCDPHHIRYGSNSGVGTKPGDDFTIPLCHTHHRELHDKGELRYLYDYGGYEKARTLAKKLYEVTGDTERALELICKWRK